ncbi:efflux RND transporter periplasmic adaptor subunit [Ectobacillus sp. sgz5001026]|uniref:efflux RND transporter periplasmic adaptor subunit n=1 Tax=Ectobacillus sp. sgz5001026 TaxID=3242473 RepID=UPI0036D2AA9D
MQTEMVQAPRRKRKWIIIGVTLLIVLVVAINIVVAQVKKGSVQADLKFATATERSMNNMKLISGRIIPGNIETIYVDATKGKVKDTFIKEGDEVKKDQKLFSYDSPELALQIKQADLDNQMKTMRSKQASDKIDSLNQDIQKAKDANAPSTVIQPLEAQVADLESQMKTIDLEKQKNDLQQQELQKKQDDLIVYSKNNGIVQKLDPDASQGSAQLQPKAFIQIASKDPFQIQGTLTELQKSQIQKGQAITITAKAVANKTWKGKIIEVSEYPTTADSGQLSTTDTTQSQTISYYTYKASLESQDGLSPGYHVSMQVNISSQKLLSVPRSSIVEENNESYVFVNENGKLKKTKVTTGLSDGEWMEVSQGVKEGDKVAESPSSKLQDGMDVKAN